VNSKVKQKWIEALRSGEYSQTSTVLFDAKGHCCLGVLVDLYLREDGYDIAELLPNEDYSNVISDHSNDGTSVMPSAEVCLWAGIDESTATELSTMNDSGSSFEDIAKHIEERIPG
jgi:hypothetical protein